MLCNGSNSVHFGIDAVNMVIGGFHWELHYITTISRIYRGQSKKKRKGGKYPVCSSCVLEHSLLMSKAKGDWSDWWGTGDSATSCFGDVASQPHSQVSGCRCD